MKYVLLLCGSISTLILSGCLRKQQQPGCTEEYSPVCAEVQIQCITAPCDPIKQTFANTCLAEQAGATVLYTGTCKDSLDANTDTQLLPAGSFGYDTEINDYAGDVYVKGYISSASSPDVMCDGTDCPPAYEYIYLDITENNNEALSNYIDSLEGNAFVKDGMMSLGCKEGDSIVYDIFMEDETGVSIERLSMSSEDSDHILRALSSKEELPFLLKKSVPVVGGTEAPACYRHFDMVMPYPHLPVEGKISRVGLDASKVTVLAPEPNTLIRSPVEIRGTAPGYRFFEATAPVSIVNRDGLIIGEGYVTAEGDWMTEDIIPFAGSIEFELTPFMPSRTGRVILRKDNPSGLPENDAAVELPIMF